MFDVGGPELLIILLAVILLFGPKKIPEMAKMIGKGINKVKQAQAQFQSQMDDIKSEMDHAGEAKKRTPKPSDEYIPEDNKENEPDSQIRDEKMPDSDRDDISDEFKYPDDYAGSERSRFSVKKPKSAPNREIRKQAQNDNRDSGQYKNNKNEDQLNDDSYTKDHNE